MTNNPNLSKFRPTFSATISAGNVIQLVTLLLAVGAGWASLSGGMAANTDAAVKNAESVREAREDTGRLKTRVRATEIAVSRQDERTNSILTGIARIEIQLQRLSERLDRRNGQ